MLQTLPQRTLSWLPDQVASGSICIRRWAGSRRLLTKTSRSMRRELAEGQLHRAACDAFRYQRGHQQPPRNKKDPLQRKESKKNGAKRIRTADPLHAMQVLYQLSYGPVGCVRRPECWWGCLSVTRHSGRPEGLAWRLLSLQRGRSGESPVIVALSDLAPDRHQAPLHHHLLGGQHDRGIGRVGGL